MPKPTFIRRQIGRRLNRLRKEAGMSLRDAVATKAINSVRTLSRLESGYEVPTVTFPVIGALCDKYGAPMELRVQMERMYMDADADGWWEPYTRIMIEGFSLFVELEQFTTDLTIYEADVVTGILQTENYARALHSKGTNLDTQTIEKSVELRMRRQHDFWSRKPIPAVRIIMWETALRSASCDDEQLDMLHQRASLPGVDIRVLPTADGPYPDVRGPYMVLAFDDPDDPDVVYTESIGSSRYDEKPEILEAHRRVFGRTFDQAKPLKEF